MPRVPRNRKQGKRKATDDPEERMTKAWDRYGPLYDLSMLFSVLMNCLCASGSPLSDINSQDVQPNSGGNDSSTTSSG